jgi:hypothetical protein
MFAVFFLFSPVGRRPTGEKRKKTAKGVRDATSLVANPSLRLGQAQRGRDKIEKPLARSIFTFLATQTPAQEHPSFPPIPK